MVAAKMKKIGSGADSVVYLLDDGTVTKSYDHLMRKVGLEACFETVQRYGSDTLKAMRLIDSEWSNFPEDMKTLNFDGVSYDLNISILPQGDVKLLDRKVLSVGQKYVSGDHLMHLLFDYEPPFFDLIMKNEDAIDVIFSYISERIWKNVGVYFNLDYKNVKPSMDKPHRKIDLTFTDLANKLVSNYDLKSVVD